MGLINIIFYVLRTLFPDEGTTRDQRRSVLDVCRIPRSNVRGRSGNISDITVVSSQCDILLCSETFDSHMRHESELLVPGFVRSVLLFRGKIRQVRGMAASVTDGD